MDIKITRASVFKSTNSRARRLAKELRLTLPECWDKLLDAGEDKLKNETAPEREKEANNATK